MIRNAWYFCSESGYVQFEVFLQTSFQPMRTDIYKGLETDAYQRLYRKHGVYRAN